MNNIGDYFVNAIIFSFVALFAIGAVIVALWPVWVAIAALMYIFG